MIVFFVNTIQFIQFYKNLEDQTCYGKIKLLTTALLYCTFFAYLNRWNILDLHKCFEGDTSHLFKLIASFIFFLIIYGQVYNFFQKVSRNETRTDQENTKKGELLFFIFYNIVMIIMIIDFCKWLSLA